MARQSCRRLPEFLKVIPDCLSRTNLDRLRYEQWKALILIYAEGFPERLAKAETAKTLTDIIRVGTLVSGKSPRCRLFRTAQNTVKTVALVAVPPAVVIPILPVTAPVGTIAGTCVADLVKFVAATRQR
jgi:hypothetical protein